jgi:hypothetical protein
VPWFSDDNHGFNERLGLSTIETGVSEKLGLSEATALKTGLSATPSPDSVDNVLADKVAPQELQMQTGIKSPLGLAPVGTPLLIFSFDQANPHPNHVNPH